MMETIELVRDASPEVESKVMVRTTIHMPTLEERRETRRKYRNLQRFLEENRKEIILDIEKLFPILEEINKIRKKVGTTTDMTLDSSLLLQVSQIAQECFRNFKRDQNQFDIHQFIRNTAANFGLNSISEESLGEVDYSLFAKQVAPYLCRAPAVTFILEPMDIEIQRRERQRVTQPLAPRQVVQPSSNLNESEANELTTSKLVLQLYQRLCEVKAPVPFYLFILNPKSFSQTIENIFCVSFMVKDALVSLTLDEEGEILLRPIPKNQSGGSSDRMQWIFSLTMQEWRELIELFNITEPKYLPHRLPSVT